MAKIGSTQMNMSSNDANMSQSLEHQTDSEVINLESLQVVVTLAASSKNSLAVASQAERLRVEKTTKVHSKFHYAILSLPTNR